MTDSKRYDIFVCGGSQHFVMLCRLLPRLHPFGTVHLASIFLTPEEIAELEGSFDVLHQPRHAADGYLNFELFCIRDLNRLARAPYFIKIDADVHLREDWIEYVDTALASFPETVLLGSHLGRCPVTVGLAGELARAVLGGEVQVEGGAKALGGFYVGSTAFFRRHDRLMQSLHELFFCFRDGRRVLPSPPATARPRSPNRGELVLTGDYQSLQEQGCEDVMRSLTVHAAGAGDRLRIVDSTRRIRQSWEVPQGVR